MMGGWRVSFVPRRDGTRLRAFLTPVLALLAAIAVGGIIITLMGRSPVIAFKVFIRDPLTDPWALQEVLLKATPLALIAIGLLFCFRANRWNIGAEGQMLLGAIASGGMALLLHDFNSPLVMPAVMLAGMAGGALYAAIPASLRNRFGISEILTSLMLVYIAELLLDYLVRGPWRDPKGFNLPQSIAFSDAASLQPFFEGGRLNIGVVIALVAVLAAIAVFSRSLFGYAVSASGEAPRAANFAGFNEKRLTLIVFLISGALAGLAGTVELTGQVGQLKPGVGMGLGFTGIIVAFLGRLSPAGAGISAIVIAVLLIGAESAQVVMKLPFDLTRFFMGMLLLFVLAGESLNRYKIVIARRVAA